MPPKSKKLANTKTSTSSSDSAFLVAAPYLYIGPRISTSASFLSSHHITHVLSIGATPQSSLPNVTYHRLSLSDDHTSSIDQVVADASKIIDAVAATPSGRVLVHCSAAVSRSPTIVTAYLVTKQGMPLKAALGLLVAARPAICPNPGFIAQLKALELKTHGCCSLDVDALPPRKIDRATMFK
ncbi:hypothetical protein PLICRDRAFT_265916 [Plicaturopsis crispa FD-325 SS-3]|nr:hypothetical protein PLICRDRAFT_265916 [Plicaturopsis crispa FD-325 SS-3]